MSDNDISISTLHRLRTDAAAVNRASDAGLVALIKWVFCRASGGLPGTLRDVPLHVGICVLCRTFAGIIGSSAFWIRDLTCRKLNLRFVSLGSMS